MVRHSFCKETKLWKWALLFVGGIALFFILYGCGLAAETVRTPWGKILTYISGAALTIAAYILAVGWTEKRQVDELSWHNAPAHVGRGLLVGVGFFVVVTAIFYVSGMYHVSGLNPDLVQLLVCFSAFLLTGVCEEVIFRGIIFRMIAERWNAAVALAVSALLFGAAHLTNPDATLWSALAIAIEAGLLLGAAYMASGSLWFPIGIHWAWNFMEGNVFGFDVSGMAPDFSLLDSDVTGPAILSGGAFGAEASLITVVLGLAISILFIRRSKVA